MQTEAVMFEVTDETDKFTGDRRINAMLQAQEGGAPGIQFAATMAGHQFPQLAGTGSYHLIFEWNNAKELDGLVGTLGLAPEASAMEFHLFYCLINGKPVQLEHTAISKRAALTDDGNETLVFIVSVTAGDLKQISTASSVECRASDHEFILNQDVRDRIGKILPLIGNAKTVTQASNEQQARAESNRKSIEGIEAILGFVGLGVILFFIIKFFG
jgi:hypothetical protein